MRRRLVTSRQQQYLSVNAVTNDAVDAVSFQPELKFCAVTLTKVTASRATSAIEDKRANALVKLLGG